MRWEAIDGKHSGDVVGVLADGWSTLPLTVYPVMVQKPAGLATVEDDEICGWRVVCSCFWQSDLWTRVHEAGRTVLQLRRVSLHRGALCDPPQAVLESLWAEWKAHSDRAAAVTELEAASRAHQATAKRLANAVATARAIERQLSWADIGQAAGMTRQAAHQRWGAQSSRPATRDA